MLKITKKPIGANRRNDALDKIKNEIGGLQTTTKPTDLQELGGYLFSIGAHPFVIVDIIEQMRKQSQ